MFWELTPKTKQFFGFRTKFCVFHYFLGKRSIYGKKRSTFFHATFSPIKVCQLKTLTVHLFSNSITLLLQLTIPLLLQRSTTLLSYYFVTLIFYLLLLHSTRVLLRFHTTGILFFQYFIVPFYYFIHLKLCCNYTLPNYHFNELQLYLTHHMW